MVTVAIMAEWGVLLAFLGQLSMGARPEGGDRAVIVLVTFTALDAFERGAMGPRLDPVKIFVASDAVEVGMDALGGTVLVDIEREDSSVPFDLKAGLPVAG